MGSTEFYQDWVLFSNSVCRRGRRESWKDILTGKGCFPMKWLLDLRSGRKARSEGYKIKRYTSLNQKTQNGCHSLPGPCVVLAMKGSFCSHQAFHLLNSLFTGQTVKMGVSCKSATKRQRGREECSWIRPQLDRSVDDRRARKPGLTSGGHSFPVMWPWMMTDPVLIGFLTEVSSSTYVTGLLWDWRWQMNMKPSWELAFQGMWYVNSCRSCPNPHTKRIWKQRLLPLALKPAGG